MHPEENEPRPGSEEELPPPVDSFHRVYFGQLSEPLVPPHPGPPEAQEDELTRQALEDPAAGLEPADSGPTAWRVVALVLFAVGALAVVFWWKR